jgi:hypothetical protein
MTTTEDTMSKLVGALLLELVADVPDKPGFESVKADRLAASQAYEYAQKKDLALRFYLAIRSLLHLQDQLEKVVAAKAMSATAGADHGQNISYQHEGTQENYSPQQYEGQH